MSAPALYQACRRMFDSLTQGSSHLCGTKQVGIINAHLGSELVMSLVIGDRGDLLMLQIAGRNVRVFADPSKWSGQEVEGVRTDDGAATAATSTQADGRAPRRPSAPTNPTSP